MNSSHNVPSPVRAFVFSECSSGCACRSDTTIADDLSSRGLLTTPTPSPPPRTLQDLQDQLVDSLNARLDVMDRCLGMSADALDRVREHLARTRVERDAARLELHEQKDRAHTMVQAFFAVHIVVLAAAFFTR